MTTALTIIGCGMGYACMAGVTAALVERAGGDEYDRFHYAIFWPLCLPYLIGRSAMGWLTKRNTDKPTGF